MSGGPSAATVFCDVCTLEVEGCDGALGEWMHSATRRERAADGHLAVPETEATLMARRMLSRKAGVRERPAVVRLAADDPRHGTIGAYANWKCRCGPCRVAKSASRDGQQDVRRSA